MGLSVLAQSLNYDVGLGWALFRLDPIAARKTLTHIARTARTSRFIILIIVLEVVDFVIFRVNFVVLSHLFFAHFDFVQIWNIFAEVAGIHRLV